MSELALSVTLFVSLFSIVVWGLLADSTNG